MVLGGRIINEIHFDPYFLNYISCLGVTLILKRKLFPKKKREKMFGNGLHVWMWIRDSSDGLIPYVMDTLSYSLIVSTLCVRRCATCETGHFLLM